MGRRLGWAALVLAVGCSAGESPSVNGSGGSGGSTSGNEQKPAEPSSGGGASPSDGGSPSSGGSGSAGAPQSGGSVAADGGSGGTGGLSTGGGGTGGEPAGDGGTGGGSGGSAALCPGWEGAHVYDVPEGHCLQLNDFGEFAYGPDYGNSACVSPLQDPSCKSFASDVGSKTVLVRDVPSYVSLLEVAAMATSCAALCD